MHDAHPNFHPVSKGFVVTGTGTIHYVRRGQGPALVLLHAAPCSAKVMELLQAEWAPVFTTFAFDLPGFGLSDAPKVDTIETHHLADAIAAAVRALGIESATFYGRHTGAGVAVEIARRHPGLCAFVLTDGYPVFATPYGKERLAEYLVPITPAWDGSHLTWTWFRYREQHMFWPWDRPTLATRADTDVPGIDFLYRGTIELLEARESYAAVYASAFRHPGLAVIGEVTPPVCYGNRAGDSQYKTVKLYPPQAWVHVFSRDSAEASREELAILRAHGGGATPPPHRSRFSDGSAQIRDYIAASTGPLYARGYGLDQPREPVLYLHDLPGGIDLHAEELKSLARKRPVVGFDFSGNSNSASSSNGRLSIPAYAEEVRDVADALGWDRVQIYAHGTSACVAVAFARRYPSRVSKIVFRSPPAVESDAAFASTYAPDITPEWSGGNLLKLWHHLRDQELWWPWYDRSIAAAKKTEPRIAPEDLQRRAMVLLKQPLHFQPIWAEVLSFDLLQGLRALNVPCIVTTQASDIFAFAAARACQTLGLGAPLDLSKPEAAANLDDWLDS